MNYKKIIGNQKIRFRILQCFSWIPDRYMLRLQYKLKLNRWPDFKHPKRFTEKLQLYKMKYRNPVLHQCVDKYEVREYLQKRGMENILIGLIGVYDDAHEIDFKTLPERFVIKTTDGGGGNNVWVCKNKLEIDWNVVVKKVNSWRNIKNVNPGREWAYTGIKKSRIVVEEFLENGECPLVDYKFFCFNGTPVYIYVVTDRKPGEYAYLGIYDIDFKKLPVYRCDERRAEQVEAKPKNYEQMLDIASKLSAGFPHVRVDLYNINGKIYFGELTFYDGSGYFSYEPDSFDFEMGKWFTEY